MRANAPARFGQNIHALFGRDKLIAFGSPSPRRVAAFRFDHLSRQASNSIVVRHLGQNNRFPPALRQPRFFAHLRLSTSMRLEQILRSLWALSGRPARSTARVTAAPTRGHAQSTT